jgi:hypothetical protein
MPEDPPVRARFAWRRPRAAVLAVAAPAAVIGLAIAGFATSPRHVALGAALTSDATPCPPLPAPSTQQIEEARQRFARQLATALGKPEQQVEQALATFEQSLPKPPAPDAPLVTHVSGPDPDTLAAIAAKLGVTSDDLADALEAAAPPPPPCPTADAGRPAVSTITLDPSQFFDEIARHLGHGITAEQVQATFESTPPKVDVSFQTSGGPATSMTPGGPDDPLVQLAAALGVTPEQLQVALRSIAESLGCPTPSPAASGRTPRAPRAGVAVAVASGGVPGPMICMGANP